MEQTVHIPFRDGSAALIDESDLPLVSQYHWYKVKSRRTYYAVAIVNGKSVFLHRFLLTPPPGFQVDHKNSQGLDCRRSNIRIVTSQENNWNRRPPTNVLKTSKYKGVGLQQGRWRVQITLNKRRITIGRYADEIEAAKVYDQHALKHYGSFAFLNFPQEVAA